MTIETVFSISDKVIFNSKVGKDYGVVTGISIRQNNCISYEVCWSNKSCSWHYDFELTKE